MKFIEHINYDNLQQLNFSNLESTLENASPSKTGKPWETKFIVKGLKKMKKENVVTYKYGKNHTSGRQYPVNFGLQYCPSCIRGYLTEGTGYKDFDIVNAHFSILYNICIKNNIPTKFLKEYVTQRNEVLQKYKLSKRQLLTFLFLDKPETYNNEFLISLDPELKLIKQFIVNLYPDLITNTENNKKNPISSQLSQILGYFENEIIMKVVKTYKLMDAVLIFDGFMSRTDLPLDALKELTGYDFVSKPFEEMDTSDIDQYIQQKEAMEVNNFISLEPFSRYSRINENYDYVLQTKADFEDRNAIYQYINSDNRVVPIMSRWIADPNKRTYDTTEFNPDPNFDNDRIFNLFKPFEVTTFTPPKEPVDIGSFMKLINNLTGNSPDYLLNYLSHLFQFPHENPQTCIVLKGKQGNGKDTLTDILNLLMGVKNNYLSKVADTERVVGNFTESLDQKLVVQLNEMGGKEGVKIHNQLKDLITTEYNLINKKYQSLQKQVNYIRWFIFSNVITPVVVELSCRRFYICETSDDLMGNVVFWNAIHNDMKNKDYLYSIYKFLMDRDISKFNPKVIPKNDDKINLQMANINPIHKFMKEEFDNQKWIVKTIKGVEYHCIKPSDLFWEYQEYEDYKDEKEKLFKKVILNLKGVSIKRIVGHSTNLYAIVKNTLIRDLSLLVPEILEEMVDDV